MLKYICSLALVFAMTGCGNDDEYGDNVPSPPATQPEQSGPEALSPEAHAPQTDISEEELRLFIDASMSAQQIQQESQQEMMAIADDEGIDVETYNEIMQAQQMGQSTDDIGVSADDMEKFERTTERIGEVEEGMFEQLSQAIEAEGMDMERFQEINMAVQQDPELQQQLQMMMQNQMQGQQPQQQPQQPPQQQPPQQQGY